MLPHVYQRIRLHAPGTSVYSGRMKTGAWGLIRHRGDQKAVKTREQAHGAVCGSLTLEAALSIPLFLFFILAVTSFLMVLHLQLHIQASMEDTARKMGKTAYLMQQADSVLDGSSGEAAQLDQGTRTIMQAGINSATISLSLQSQSLRQVLDGSRVTSGSSGLYTYASTYEPESGILDMVVSYDYRVPWLPGSLGNLRLVQRAMCHAWVGDSLEKDSSSGGNDTHKVYVTPTGTVYHTSPDCHYLDLSIHSVSGYSVAGLRNASGAKYGACEICARGGHYDTVYITDYGTNYHSTLGCSGLKRTVQEVDLEEVGNLRMCTKCAQNEPHTH